MPELPEVEIVRRGLEPVLAGQRLARVVRRRGDLRFPLPERFAERLLGREVTALERRAKYLLARLRDGEVLVMHLGMTGRFTVTPPLQKAAARPGSSRVAFIGGSPPPDLPRKGGGTVSPGTNGIAAPDGGRLPFRSHDGIPPPLWGRSGGGEPPPSGVVASAAQPERHGAGLEPAELLGTHIHDPGANPKHDHVVFVTGSGFAITYNDPRRFGFMLLVPEKDLTGHRLFRDLGPEPLGRDFDAEYLARRCLGRASGLKTFLMDQRVVAGLGNIYASESLHRAGLSPNRRAASLARRDGAPGDRARRLAGAIRAVLEEAIAAGGSTLRDYRHADGTRGGFQDAFRVYGRDREPCLRPGCRGTVRRTISAGRSTFFCGVCQR